MYVQPTVLGLVFCLLAVSSGLDARPQQDSGSQQTDTFFAGTVLETTTAKVVVSRVVLGKTEKREFRVTSGTKVEGRLRAKVRVTVRYITDDDGDTATLIIVRTAQQLKPK